MDDRMDVRVFDSNGDPVDLPGSIAELRIEMRRVLLGGGYERGLALLLDPELTDQTDQ